MDFIVLNLFLIVIGVGTIVLSPITSRLNARSFPVPNYRIAYFVSLSGQITTGLLLIFLGGRGLLLNCPPFPIEGAPPHCW